MGKNSLSGDSPHEKRFEIQTDTSTVIGKSHKVSDWGKSSQKKTLHNQIRKSFYYCGDYTPNYDQVQKKLDTGCKFEISFIKLIQVLTLKNKWEEQTCTIKERTQLMIYSSTLMSQLTLMPNLAI